jgi:hypothetical protein
MALAVTEAAPFAIEVIQPKVPLVRSGSMNVAVKATRNEGFKAPIKLRMLWNPPGVGSQNEVTLGEGQTAATYTLNANGGAAIRTWKLAILASSDAGQGTLWTSSQLFDVTVAEPFVAMEIPLSAGEQGADIAVLCKLRQLQPFDGEATVHLHGLPPKVALAANPLSITKTNEQVVFTANVATNAPVGQHKSLFCQVVITRDGEPVIHNIGGGGILRIDAPPPPKPQPSAAPKAVAEVKPAAPPEAPKPVPAKPLSRLEQLRLQSRQRAGEQ